LREDAKKEIESGAIKPHLWNGSIFVWLLVLFDQILHTRAARTIPEESPISELEFTVWVNNRRTWNTTIYFRNVEDW
jgi:hypothetical protein